MKRTRSTRRLALCLFAGALLFASAGTAVAATSSSTVAPAADTTNATATDGPTVESAVEYDGSVEVVFAENVTRESVTNATVIIDGEVTEDVYVEGYDRHWWLSIDEDVTDADSVRIDFGTVEATDGTTASDVEADVRPTNTVLWAYGDADSPETARTVFRGETVAFNADDLYDTMTVESPNQSVDVRLATAGLVQPIDTSNLRPGAVYGVSAADANRTQYFRLSELGLTASVTDSTLTTDDDVGFTVEINRPGPAKATLRNESGAVVARKDVRTNGGVSNAFRFGPQSPGNYTVTVTDLKTGVEAEAGTVTVTGSGPAGANVSVTDLSVNSTTPTVGETVRATVTARNTGDAAGTKSVTLTTNGTALETENVTVAAGETATVGFDVAMDGIRTVELGAADRAVTVTATLPGYVRPDRSTVVTDVTATSASGVRHLGVTTFPDVTTNETVAFDVNVSNPTAESRSYRIRMTDDETDEVLNATTVELGPDAARTVTLSERFETAGDHDVSVGSESFLVSARERPRTVTVAADGPNETVSNPVTVYPSQDIEIRSAEPETPVRIDTLGGENVLTAATDENGTLFRDAATLATDWPYVVRFGTGEDARTQYIAVASSSPAVANAIERNGTVSVTFTEPVVAGSVDANVSASTYESTDPAVGDDDGDRHVTFAFDRDLGDGEVPVLGVTARSAIDGSTLSSGDTVVTTTSAVVDRESGTTPDDAVTVLPDGKVAFDAGRNRTVTVTRLDGSSHWRHTTARNPVFEEYTANYEPGGTYAVTFGAESDAPTRYFTVAESMPSAEILDASATANGTVTATVEASAPGRAVFVYAEGVDGSESVVRTRVGSDARATVSFPGLDAGEYNVTVHDDDAFRFSDAETVAVPGPVEPIEGQTPTDPDGDGLFEDLNGNERIDYNDVVLYFQYRTDPVLTDHVPAYDYNDNERLDYNDVVLLFGERV